MSAMVTFWGEVDWGGKCAGGGQMSYGSKCAQPGPVGSRSVALPSPACVRLVFQFYQLHRTKGRRPARPAIRFGDRSPATVNTISGEVAPLIIIYKAL